MLIIVMVISLGGCATAKKKFVRKKKSGPAQRAMYTEKEFVKTYSNEYYYSSHFSMWKVWHDDLIGLLEGNKKSRQRAADETLNHLYEMKKYLNEEKALELQIEIDRVQIAVGRLVGGKPNISSIRFTLEKSLRLIRSRFFTGDVKEYIKPDEIRL